MALGLVHLDQLEPRHLQDREEGGHHPVPVAIAQNTPQQDAYGGVIAEVVTPSKPKPQQQTAAQQQAPVAAAPSSALPFTGLQVTLVLLAGAALLGTGLVLRRVTGGDRS